MERILGAAPAFWSADLEGELSSIKRAGFDATFLDWNREDMKKDADLARRLGLFVQSIHSPFCGDCHVSDLWRGGKEGVAVRDLLLSCLEDCARCEIPVMVIHPFIGFKDHTPTDVGIENYAKIVKRANELGVTLGFENVEGEEYLAALMQAFWNEPSLGFCLDTGHELCYNGGKDMLALYGEKLCHTHFNDNLGVYDPALTWENDLHLVPLDGIVDFKNVMQRIEKTPYQGPIVFELSVSNKPGRHDHDRYREMGFDGFYTFAFDRARKAVFGK